MEALNTPIIETERLLLRRFRPEDIPALFSIYSDSIPTCRGARWPPVRKRSGFLRTSTRRRTGSPGGIGMPSA